MFVPYKETKDIMEKSDIIQKHPGLVCLNENTNRTMTELFFVYGNNSLYKNIWQFKISREEPSIYLCTITYNKVRCEKYFRIHLKKENKDFTNFIISKYTDILASKYNVKDIDEYSSFKKTSIENCLSEAILIASIIDLSMCKKILQN